jgi:hypothetical protein
MYAMSLCLLYEDFYKRIYKSKVIITLYIYTSQFILTLADLMAQRHFLSFCDWCKGNSFPFDNAKVVLVLIFIILYRVIKNHYATKKINLYLFHECTEEERFQKHLQIREAHF